jgi:hypothetical protein
VKQVDEDKESISNTVLSNKEQKVLTANWLNDIGQEANSVLDNEQLVVPSNNSSLHNIEKIR